MNATCFGCAKERRAVVGRARELPVIGPVKMRENARSVGNIKSVTVSRVADRRFAGVSVDVDHVVPDRENQSAVAVDPSVAHLAKLSDDSMIEWPKVLRRRSNRRSRRQADKRPGSANRREYVGMFEFRGSLNTTLQ